MQHREIERAVYSGILLPKADWHSLTHEGPGGLRLTYRVRVQCDPNYFNSTCMKLCRPRDDNFGHYTCDRQGDKFCLPGWTGANCETGSKNSQIIPSYISLFTVTLRLRLFFFHKQIKICIFFFNLTKTNNEAE